MARVRRERIYRNFSGGLNTEFGKLSFPENTLTDAVNIVLKRDGALSVRDGIGLTAQDGYNLGAFSSDWLPLANYVWRSAAGTDIDLLVVGINNYNSTGPKLFFFSIDSSTTMTSYVGELDLATYSSGVYTGEAMQMAVVGNVLVVAGDCLEFPVYVVYRNNQILDLYNRDESLPTALQRGSYNIRLQIRDFADASSTFPDERPSELTDAHKYDLWNRGWPSKDVDIEEFRRVWGDVFGDPLYYFAQYQTIYAVKWKRIPRSARAEYARELINSAGVAYPSKSDPYLGGSRSTYGRFDLRLYGNLNDPIGSIPKGHFIVDARTYDREVAGGIAGLTAGKFTTPARYRAVAGFAGRAWYAGSTEQSQANTVFYSQIVTGEQYDNLAKCYQDNDPTDPDINDVLDTDGGTIEIEGAGRIMQLIPYSNSIVVLATNGVWEINGGSEQGFKPTSVRVRKLSSDGVVSTTAGVLAESAVVYFARGGIYAVQADPTLGTLSAVNISQNSIQTFYRQNISNSAKTLAKAVYDDYNRLVYWLYPNNDISDDYYDAALVLDTRLSAFYPLQFEIGVSTPKIVGGYLSPPVGTSTFQEEVTVDAEVVTVDDEEVYVTETQGSTGFSDMLFLCLSEDGSSLLQAAMIDRNKVDWGTEAYSAYAETGDNVVDDPSRIKDIVNMTAWFTITEDEVVDIGGGNVDFAHQSKCRFRVKWEWTDSASANRWSTIENIYQLPANYTPTGVETEDTFDYGYTVATVQRAVNGSGRAVRMRFENHPGYGFELIGVSLALSIEEMN